MYHDKQMVLTSVWTRLMIRLMSAKCHIHAYIIFHMNNNILKFTKNSKNLTFAVILTFLPLTTYCIFKFTVRDSFFFINIELSACKAECLRCSLIFNLMCFSERWLALARIFYHYM